MYKKGENLLSGMPSHLLRRGKSLTGMKPVERVIFVRNNTKKAINLSQGSPGYRMDIAAGDHIKLSEEQWKQLLTVFTTTEMLAAGLKFDQDYEPVKEKKDGE